MTDHDAPRRGFGEPRDSQPDAYRAFSGLAAASLVFGVLSAAALVDPVAAIVSVVGVLTGGAALWQIARRSPELVGRKTALAGVLLSLLFAAVSLGHTAAYHWLLVRDARAIGTAWFEMLAHGQPQWAHQLGIRPDDRQPPGADAWAVYRSNRALHDSLEKYVAESLIRTLLALGEKAKVRFYALEETEGPSGKEIVTLLYAVTFDEDGQKTTFLVRLLAQHVPTKFDDRAAWRVMDVRGGVQPLWETDPALR